MNIFKNLAVMSIAAIMLIACGGDNGSSANDDEIDSSSSSVILSSSSEGSSSSAKSSSSVASSSSAKSSSSTAKSSSSVASSSSAKSSSSSAKSSSSSVKISSSSEYVPFDHSVTLAGVFEVGKDAYKQFTDERNGRSYYYITIVGKDTNNVKATVTIMAENLNIGKDVAGVDDQNDDSVIERYCYKDDTTMCDRFGGLYQWAEMMQLPSRCNTESCANLIQENHQGICPDGWRLMNKNDFAIVVKSEDNTDGLKGLRSSRFQGSNASGFSLLPAGMRTNDSEVFRSINETAFWYYPQEHISEEKKSYIGYVFASGSYPSGSKDYRDYGLSVRCAKLETEE